MCYIIYMGELNNPHDKIFKQMSLFQKSVTFERDLGVFLTTISKKNMGLQVIKNTPLTFKVESTKLS